MNQHTENAEKPHDIANFGQVFTPPAVVQAMLALRQNQGRVLEPSCGDGAFSRYLPDAVAIELDPVHAPEGSLRLDFFAYPECEKFATIIGNPPYVRYQDILPGTRALLRSRLFDQRSNLYLFFIEKAIRHLDEGGELIFITPRDFLKTTSSARLNQWLHAQGSITHAIELGDAKIFSGAVPNCLIWRFELGCRERSVRYAEIGYGDKWPSILAAPPWEERYFIETAGQLMFSREKHLLPLKSIASVKVGAVSGADDIYADAEQGNRDFVCASTRSTGKTRRMIWIDKGDVPPDCLLPHKERLIARGIKPFDESNWWHWGRGYPENRLPRIYVNGKTRQAQPFFLHPCRHFDGAILAVFPHDPACDLQALCAALNTVPWEQLGFVCDGRYLFTQRSLENAPLPAAFACFLPPGSRQGQLL